MLHKTVKLMDDSRTFHMKLNREGSGLGGTRRNWFRNVDL